MSLRRFIVRRLLLVIPILFGVSVITFVLANIAPSNAIDLLISFNPNIDPGDIARIKEQYGLNDPIHVRYIDWMTGVLQGCSAGTESGWTPETLNAHQNELVVTVSEMIIPATDTPGAEAANVNRFVDKMLTEWFYEEERSHFLSGLDELDAMSEERFGSGFLDASEKNRTGLLTELDEEAFGEDVSGGLEEAEETPFFRTMKDLTRLGDYTSEIGMTQELQWMAAPGKYDGCVPLEEVGRTWA
jgi:hypothetical protein